jgi:SagB-type dehydrogenase family enzyme
MYAPLRACPTCSTRALILLGLLACLPARGEPLSSSGHAAALTAVDLPPARAEGPMSVEAALRARRSVRVYRPEPLDLAEVAQLLFAVEGVTHASGKRTAPSAGALYPIDAYLVAGDVIGLAPGVYRYLPGAHRLEAARGGDLRAQLARAALDQSWIADAPAAVVLAAVARRTTVKYGARGARYVLVDAGFAAENLQLQATAMGLGAAVVGAFDDQAVTRLLAPIEGSEPVLIMPVGRRVE